MSEQKGSPIKCSEFMNTAEELHAFTHGICEIICPWPPFRQVMSEDRAKELQSEYHYYLLGRAAGILAWVAICCIIKVVFF